MVMVRQAKSPKGMSTPQKSLRSSSVKGGGVLALFGSQVRISEIAETHNLGSNVRKHFLAELSTVP